MEDGGIALIDFHVSKLMYDEILSHNNIKLGLGVSSVCTNNRLFHGICIDTVSLI